MQIKDFQFILHFINNYVKLPPEEKHRIFNIEIKVETHGETDSVITRNNSITLVNPTSVTKSLFNILYKVLSKYAVSNYHKDKLALVLIELCRRYIYCDFNNIEIKNRPPVIMSYNKNLVPSIIIHELIEPLTKTIKTPKLLFMNCPFTDCCRIINTSKNIYNLYNIDRRQIDLIHEYPLILVNTSVYNEAAKTAHIVYLTVLMEFGYKQTCKIFKNILLENDQNCKKLTTIIKILENSLEYTVNFIKFLQSHLLLNEEEIANANDMQIKIFQSDNHFKKQIKQAQDAHFTPNVWKQWSEWAMLVGLTENQLEPMRGSAWPATEKLKPIEDEKKTKILEKAKQLNKKTNELTFEELLEIARDWYNHNAIEPGKLYEELLKEHRVWKV